MARRQSLILPQSGGLSSSLLDLGRHAVAYPGVKYANKTRLRTTTIDQLIADWIIPADIDVLLINAQGAELLILNGATSLLSGARL